MIYWREGWQKHQFVIPKSFLWKVIVTGYTEYFRVQGTTLYCKVLDFTGVYCGGGGTGGYCSHCRVLEVLCSTGGYWGYWEYWGVIGGTGGYSGVLQVLEVRDTWGYSGEIAGIVCYWVVLGCTGGYYGVLQVLGVLGGTVDSGWYWGP